MTKSIHQTIDYLRLLDHETPYFYTSKQILEANYNTFVNTFDDAEVYYALKANSDPKILTFLASLGCGFEAASYFEVELLISLGVQPSRIIYGTSIKPADHIHKSFQAGIHRFAADSTEELEKIAANAPGSKIFIRSIVDDSGSVFTMSERFGAPPETVTGLLLYARKLGLKTYGISFYVGSQATSAKRWAQGIKTIQPAIEALLHEGITLEVINIGGGFPVMYSNHRNAPDLAQIVKGIHDALHILPYIPKLLMEPGRAIVATSTVLVAEVIARNDRFGRPWLCLDGGNYNALYEALIHQGSTLYPVHPLTPPTEDATPMMCTLAGPTGDSLDIIARDVILPAYTGVGDRLVFENAGAYTIAMATKFNGFPTPSLYIG